MTERTIYVVRRGYDSETLPIEAVNPINSVELMLEHGLVWNETSLTSDDTPPKVTMCAPTSVKGSEGLFFDCLYNTRETALELPDIFTVYDSTIVSEACRDAILSADGNARHEFVATTIRNLDQKEVSEQKFFHFWCGRRVFTDYKLPRVDQKHDLANQPEFRSTLGAGSHEKRMIGAPEILRYLCDVPCWSWMLSGGTTYFSEHVFGALKAAELNGIEEFTQTGGKSEADADGHLQKSKEYVGHIFIEK